MKTRLNLLVALAASLLLAAGFAFSAGARSVLKVAYPAPTFHGTPKPLGLVNVEPWPASAPQLLVPPDTALLSRGRPVTSSDSQPIIGELGFVTDGDKSGIDGTVVELGPGRQWVQIDLGAPARIDAIALWHYHSEPRAYHDVVVQVSSDPAFVRDVVTVFNNDHDNSLRLGAGRDRTYLESHFGRLIAARGVTGRHLRLHSQGNTSDEMNHYAEVEIYGAFAPAASR